MFSKKLYVINRNVELAQLSLNFYAKDKEIIRVKEREKVYEKGQGKEKTKVIKEIIQAKFNYLVFLVNKKDYNILIR